jgi:hypothetical protein
MHAQGLITGIHLPSRLLPRAPRQCWPQLRMRGSLRRLFAELRRDLFNSYRPERHYMRGRGPAWRAKQAQRAAGRFTTAQ